MGFSMRGTRFAAVVSTSAALFVGLLAGPSTAATSTVTGDIRGTAKAVGGNYLSVAITATPSSLRLIKGRTVKFTTGRATLITLDGSRAALRDIVAADTIAARVRCTFTITSSATRISCTAIRLNATSPTSVTPPLSGPVTFVATGKVAGLQKSALALTPTNIDADAQATPVVAALRTALPIWLSVDSATVVMFGTSNATFAAVSGGNTVTVNVTCQPKVPYNCKATRIEIALPGKEPVKIVGLVTLTTASSVTLNVESVVHTTVATTDVHMLKLSQLAIAVPAGTPVTSSGSATTLGALPLGVRVTVTAQCRLVVPFDCAADRVTM